MSVRVLSIISIFLSITACADSNEEGADPGPPDTGATPARDSGAAVGNYANDAGHADGGSSPGLSAPSDAGGKRFIDGRDGTVLDNQTKFTWQREVSATTYTWQDAKSYCAALTLSGAGWRLPTKVELRTLVITGSAEPSIDVIAFPATPAEEFWSASSGGDTPGIPDGIDFGAGDSFSSPAEYQYYARCVR